MAKLGALALVRSGVRKLRGPFLVFTLAFAERAVEAQEPPLSSVSLKDALLRAQASAPDVVVSITQARATRGDIGVAGALPNPRLTLGTTTGAARISGSLFIALPIFGQRQAAIDVAEAQARVALAGVDVTRLDARLAATQAWIGVWLVDAELRIARETAARRQRTLETARIRFAEGATPRLDVLRATTEANKAQAEVAALEEQRSAADAGLAVLLGGEASAPLEPSGEPRGLENVPSVAELEALVGEHPVSSRAKGVLHAADAIVAREQRARWPLLGVQLGANLFERYPPPSRDFTISLAIDVPLFSAPLVARAEGVREATRVELRAVTVQLRARMIAARADYLAAARRCDVQTGAVLPSAREAAELAAEAYRSGGLDLTGALAAEQALSDAKLAVARSIAERGRALGLLEHAVGRGL